MPVESTAPHRRRTGDTAPHRRRTGDTAPHRRRSGRRRLRTVAAAWAAALVLLAGCGGGSSTSSSGLAGDQPVDQPALGAPDVAVGKNTDSGSVSGGEGVAGGAAEPAVGPPGAALVLDPGRDVVRTADVSVGVTDVGAAADRVGALATAAGGEVSADQRHGGSDPTVADGTTAYADLILRLPPERLDTVLTDVTRLGEEVSRTLGAQDVTTVVADVDARVRSQQASVDRLRTLIGSATEVGDLIALEGQLTSRESDLESLQAQQRALADQVGMATLSVHLESAAAGDRASSRGFLGGLSDGWDAFVGVFAGLFVALGAALPFLVLVGAVAALALAYRRRRARGAPAVRAEDPVASAT